MFRRPFVLTSMTLAVVVACNGLARAQSGGYPYRATAPSGYRGPDMQTPQSTISPNTVSRSAHSSARSGPDQSFPTDGLGAGLTGDYLPGFLRAQDARTDRAAGVRLDPTARLRLRVPGDAQVWVDGGQTRQTGADRLFHTPPLTPGRRYYYDVRVRWMKDGQPVQQERRIAVAAGARVAVDFTGPVAGAANSSGEKENTNQRR